MAQRPSLGAANKKASLRIHDKLASSERLPALVRQEVEAVIQGRLQHVGRTKIDELHARK